MAWIYLVLAGVCEIGWPIGLKLGWTPTGARPLWLGFAIACMAVSGVLLLLAQRVIPMGTAYAVWTGIGAAGSLGGGNRPVWGCGLDAAPGFGRLNHCRSCRAQICLTDVIERFSTKR